MTSHLRPASAYDMAREAVMSEDPSYPAVAVMHILAGNERKELHPPLDDELAARVRDVARYITDSEFSRLLLSQEEIEQAARLILADVIAYEDQVNG